MELPKIEEYKEKFIAGWQALLQKSDEYENESFGRERIIVFILALILAFALWLMVNLSREYTLNIEFPIRLGAVPADKALVEELPQSTAVSVTGEGWKLINLYNNPTPINIDINDDEVNLLEQIQQQMNAMLNINIQKVQPQYISVQLADRVTKKVPVRSAVTVDFKNQFDLVSQPSIKPDSITISGAASLVEDIEMWKTESVQIGNVAADISEVVPLQAPGKLLTLSHNEVAFKAEVAQYTEGEVQANITTRNLPPGRVVSYSPLSIRVKYDVPINEYADVQDIDPFEVYVTFQQILEDSTGFVTPQIEEKSDKYHAKLRSFQPRRVAYFMVLDE